MFSFTGDGELGCCEWPKTTCMAGLDIDEYGGIFALLDVSGMRVPVNPSGYPEVMNSGEPTRELLGRIAPCFFKVTISNVRNYDTVDNGYCYTCDNFNQEYILSKDTYINNIEYKNISNIFDTYYNWAARYRSNGSCDSDNQQLCGFNNLNIVIFPSSYFFNDSSVYSAGAFSDLLISTSDIDIYMDLVFTWEGFHGSDPSFVGFSQGRNDLVFRKKIGKLLSNGRSIYDSDLYGPIMNHSMDINDRKDTTYLWTSLSCSGNRVHNDNDTACDWSDATITIESLDDIYTNYNYTNDICSLLKRSTNTNPKYHQPGKDNNSIFLSFDDVISVANDSGNFTSIPFPSAVVSTCYKCESWNEKQIGLKRDTYLLSATILIDNIAMMPGVSGSSVVDLWYSDLHNVKNDPSGITSICCLDNSLPMRSYVEHSGSSCIDGISFHIQSSYSRSDDPILNATNVNDTEDNNWTTNIYYNYYGIINFYRGKQFQSPSNQVKLVQQLYQKLCTDCEQHSYTFNYGKGSSPPAYTRNGVPTLTYPCSDTFNSNGWTESSGYNLHNNPYNEYNTIKASSILDEQRPCNFDFANIDILTTEDSVLNSGCRFNACPCREPLKSLDVVVSIPNGWISYTSPTPNCTNNLSVDTSVDTSIVEGDFVLSTDYSETVHGWPCSSSSYYYFPSGSYILFNKFTYPYSGFIYPYALEFRARFDSAFDDQLRYLNSPTEYSAVILHTLEPYTGFTKTTREALTWKKVNADKECLVHPQYIKDCTPEEIDGEYTIGQGVPDFRNFSQIALTNCFTWDPDVKITVSMI